MCIYFASLDGSARTDALPGPGRMVDRVGPPQAKFDDTIEDLRDHQIATLLNYLRITRCRQLRSA